MSQIAPTVPRPQHIEDHRRLARALSGEPHQTHEEHAIWKWFAFVEQDDPMQIVCTCGALIDEPTHAMARAAYDAHVANAGT